MNLSQKLSKRAQHLQRYSHYRGIFHHQELEGEVGNRMMFKGKEHIVWCMNDYLGLMNNAEAKQIEGEATLALGAAYPHSSRHTFGHTQKHDQLETEIADLMQKESAFLFQLGYMGIFSMIDAITDRHDTIIYDQYVHACAIDGVRLHNGRKFAFKHNDIEHLRKQLINAKKFQKDELGTTIVIVDGVYSMHGDIAPLDEIAELKKEFDFALIVDDSHGFGVFGVNGRGTPEFFEMEEEVDLYVSTFTKSMGSLGAFVAGKKDIIEFVRYNTRSQIFSRTLPLPQVLSALKKLEIFRNEPERRIKLWENIRKFQKGLEDSGISIGKTQSAVTPIVINGTVEEGLNILSQLRDLDVFSYMVTYPVVPEGTSLIRMVPTYNHTDEDIRETIEAFKIVKEKNPKAFTQNEAVIKDYKKNTESKVSSSYTNSHKRKRERA